jgi:hypothetical protein
MSVKEIKKEIREHKREMKERGIRVIGFMNGGLTMEESRANQKLYALKIKLDDALKAEQTKFIDISVF